MYGAADGPAAIPRADRKARPAGVARLLVLVVGGLGYVAFATRRSSERGANLIDAAGLRAALPFLEDGDSATCSSSKLTAYVTEMCESFNGTCIAATTAGVASCTALSGTVDYGGCGGSTDDDDGGCACCKYESNSTSTTNSSAADDDGDDGDDDASATCASPGLTSYEEAMCGYSSGTCYANTTAGRAACDGDPDYGGCGGVTTSCFCCKESSASSTDSADSSTATVDDSSATCASSLLLTSEETICEANSGTCYANTTDGRAACSGTADYGGCGGATTSCFCCKGTSASDDDRQGDDGTPDTWGEGTTADDDTASSSSSSSSSGDDYDDAAATCSSSLLSSFETEMCTSNMGTCYANTTSGLTACSDESGTADYGGCGGGTTSCFCCKPQ